MFGEAQIEEITVVAQAFDLSNLEGIDAYAQALVNAAKLNCNNRAIAMKRPVMSNVNVMDATVLIRGVSDRDLVGRVREAIINTLDADATAAWDDEHRTRDPKPETAYWGKTNSGDCKM